MKEFDALIVGAGPCGCAAASTLARAGHRTALLDRAVFPRTKLCGGLLTWKTRLMLNRLFGWGDHELEAQGGLECTTRQYAIYHMGWERLSAGSLGAEPFCLVNRSVFDTALLQEAAAAGVHVFEGVNAREAEPHTGRVQTDQGVFRGRWVIGADGANSRMRRAVPHDAGRWRRNLAATIEVHVPRQKARHLAVTCPQLHAGHLRAGYGWVFPNRDTVAVGICGLPRCEAESFADIFHRFAADLALPQAAEGELHGHPLPYGNWLHNPVHQRLLLAGDAAGFVEPLLGEGIFYALYTGMLAARSVDSALIAQTSPEETYCTALHQSVFREFKGADRLRWAMFTALRLLGPAPLSAFVNRGGQALVDMVQGKRSYLWLKRTRW